MELSFENFPDLLRAALFDAASKRQTFAPPFHAVDLYSIYLLY
jgi:hypothetical protein